MHTHAREMVIGVYVHEILKCKILYTQHLLRLTPNSFSLSILGLMARNTYRKYHIIAVSQPVADEIKKHKLLGKNKLLFLVENKLNLNFFKPKPKKNKEYTSVVYVARIGHPKAHTELIQAWSKLLDEPTPKKLILVGPDGLNNEIHNLVKKIIPNDSVIFMGSQYKISEILNECNFAVFPSFKEGLPIALLEKMAMELPVIVSDIEGLTNVIDDQENGLVFKCGDSDDLAKKIAILLQNPSMVIELGKNARQKVEKKYGSDNIAFANEAVYEEILKSV